MRKENRVLASNGEISIRMTRSRAALLGSNGTNIPPNPPTMKQVEKYVLQGNTKRVALDESSSSGPHFQSKKRAVLKDVSNILSDISRKKCTHSVKIQTKNCTVSKPGGSKIDLKKSHASPIDVKHVEIGANASEEVKKKTNLDVQDILVSVELGELVPTEECIDEGPDKITQKCTNADQFPKERMSENSCTSAITSKVITDLCEEHGESKELSFNDIDCDQTNLRLCSLYAADIYHNLRVAELFGRPSSNFMEILQRDITQNMRGILIDWLVEVSEEYKLVPDTLYLTVYVIDRFLSQNYIERQKLQLLGITSMLIASKYQEICAPRVEEFCFITDNTYTKAEVLKMESKVLTYLGFQLSFPTIKTFLRRYVRAAQVSCKISSRTLECMANFLAELSLVEYSFLKFIPSLVAASAVFLAKWTLYQSDHPWNSTLQYYSLYKPPDLKETVIKMRELQINSKGCPLNAVREKYKQEKFECVATLSSPELLEDFF